jgi:hypothetical protein
MFAPVHPYLHREDQHTPATRKSPNHTIARPKKSDRFTPRFSNAFPCNLFGEKQMEDVFELAQWIADNPSYQPTDTELETMRQKYAELNPSTSRTPLDTQALANALLKVLAAV